MSPKTRKEVCVTENDIEHRCPFHPSEQLRYVWSETPESWLTSIFGFVSEDHIISYSWNAIWHFGDASCYVNYQIFAHSVDIKPGLFKPECTQRISIMLEILWVRSLVLEALCVGSLQNKDHFMETLFSPRTATILQAVWQYLAKLRSSVRCQQHCCQPVTSLPGYRHPADHYN